MAVIRGLTHINMPNFCVSVDYVFLCFYTSQQSNKVIPHFLLKIQDSKKSIMYVVINVL